jgi:hypothetical protein
VRDLARHPHLGVEALETVFFGRQVSRQELQRDRLAQLQVVGAIHLAHSPAAEQTDDPVALGEHHARREADDLDDVGGGEPADF